MQGTWKWVTQEGAQHPASAEDLEKTTIMFSGDKWIIRDGDKVIQAGTQKLNATKKPSQIDTVATEGPDKGDIMLGIYELKGDTLKVCFDPKGKERPSSFTAKAGQLSGTLNRVKKN